MFCAVIDVVQWIENRSLRICKTRHKTKIFAYTLGGTKGVETTRASPQVSTCEELDLKEACRKYNSSTFFRAHGVLRKNFKLDLMLGSCVKQRTGTAALIASQPIRSDSWVTIISRVMPSKLGRLVVFFVVLMVAFYRRWPGLSVYNGVLDFQVAPLMSEPIRLAKRLVELFGCSRREAELYIAGGWVMVDGQVVEEPQFMVSQQEVTLHPDALLTPLEPVTILYHQPADMTADAVQPIRADTHAADDVSGIRMLKQHLLRLTQCTPLEPTASGLLVFTQDWRVARKLIDDGATVEQEYVVEVAGDLPAEGLKKLNHGLTFNGRALPPIKVSWQNETRLRFALKGVQPGQIRHMCESVGLQVLGMKRIRLGRVSMAKLPPGQWRYLMPQERF